MKEAVAQVDDLANQTLVGNQNTDAAAMNFLATHRVEFEWGTAFVASDTARGDSTLFSAQLGADPTAFQYMYNSLLAAGVDQQALRQM